MITRNGFLKLVWSRRTKIVWRWAGPSLNGRYSSQRQLRLGLVLLVSYVCFKYLVPHPTPGSPVGKNRIVGAFPRWELISLCYSDGGDRLAVLFRGTEKSFSVMIRGAGQCNRENIFMRSSDCYPDYFGFPKSIWQNTRFSSIFAWSSKVWWVILFLSLLINVLY